MISLVDLHVKDKKLPIWHFQNTNFLSDKEKDLKDVPLGMDHITISIF